MAVRTRFAEIGAAVWKITAPPGTVVAEDEPVVILESMKMEIPVLAEVDGRKLVFDVKAYDECGLIGQGRHERFIIYSEKFLAKTNAKLSR